MTTPVADVETDPLARVQVHPAAELFPLMQGAEFDRLVGDIREHGQRVPVVMTPDGLLLDGRNRWRACAAAGLGPETRIETSEPWAFVISTNVHRRHLSDVQRAMIGARIAERHRGGSTKIVLKAPDGALSEGVDRPPSQEEATHLLNVSRRSIQRARAVINHGTDALQQATEAGRVPVTTAERVAQTMTPAEQDDFVREVEAGAKPRQMAPPKTQPPAPSCGKGQQYRKAATINRRSIVQITSSVRGMEVGLLGVDSVESSITREEAAKHAADLAKSLTALRTLVRILKEHNPA